ncbi:hypothetical protein M8494_23225 [Serratia ureilytica]
MSVRQLGAAERAEPTTMSGCRSSASTNLRCSASDCRCRNLQRSPAAVGGLADARIFCRVGLVTEATRKRFYGDGKAPYAAPENPPVLIVGDPPRSRQHRTGASAGSRRATRGWHLPTLGHARQWALRDAR